MTWCGISFFLNGMVEYHDRTCLNIIKLSRFILAHIIFVMICMFILKRDYDILSALPVKTYSGFAQTEHLTALWTLLRTLQYKLKMTCRRLYEIVWQISGTNMHTVLVRITFICDVIWENQACGGTKRTGSDQTLHVRRGVRSEPGLFVSYEHLQKTLFSISTHFRNNPWI